MNHRARRRLLAPFLLLTLVPLLLLTACGGGSGGPTIPPDPDPDPDPPPATGLRWSPDEVSGPRTLTLRRQGDDDERLVLELFANQVNDLYGVAFDLRYPTDVLTLDLVREESFLSGNNAVDTTQQMAEVPAGNLVLGLTRLEPGNGASGSGVLLTLEFRVVGEGSGTLTFSGNEAYDPAGNAFGNYTWGGGTVEND